MHAAIGIVAVCVLITIFAGWAGEDDAHLGADAFAILILSLPWVIAWLACAFGIGLPLRLMLARDAEDANAIQFALGIALLLLLIAALGRTGLLQIGGHLGAWALLLLGIGLCVEQWRRQNATQHPPHSTSDVSAHSTYASSHLYPVLLLAAAPAIAILLIAAITAPGWLWRTEFGGYDVMSYHLQLPKEWLALGAISPLDHNVYSFLPSYVEGAYYHLMVLRGDAVSAVYAAQLLHASFVLIAAWLVARFVLRLTSGVGIGAVTAGVILLGTPWVIVTGSLAYNEIAVIVMLAGGLLVMRGPSISPWHRGAMIGVLAAAACGAKLTAVGFAALPLVVLLLMTVAMRAWPKAFLAGAIAAIIVLSPYLISNAAATGNPVFPFATTIFGSGHWSEEQVAIWNEGHRAAGPITDRAVEAWRQLFQFGIGPDPYENEPWLPQWSILPWLAIASIAVLLASRAHRSWGLKLLVIMLLQLAFWIGFTHIKSRFMLPMVVPASIAFALCIGTAFSSRWPTSETDTTAASRQSAISAPAIIALFVCLLIWSSIPVWIYAGEARGAPAARIGFTGVLTGDALHPTDRETLGRGVLPTIYINHLMPDHARVLFIGEAAPLYYRHGRYDYRTTWDRGPMSAIMHEYPDEPDRWPAKLRRRGYTHILIDPTMLRIWEDAGWNDPNLTVDRVLSFAESHLHLEQAWPAGERLYRLE